MPIEHPQPSVKQVAFFTICCIAVLTLFAWLGRYVFPIADDHSYGAQFFSQAFWETQIRLYHSWSGRYIANMLFAPLGSLSGNLTLYHLYASIHLALLVVAMRALVGAFHEGGGLRAWGITSALAASFMAGLPSPSQGLYWMSGAVTYFIPFNAFFGLMALVVHRVLQPARWTMLHSVILVLCLFITMGCNEITTASTAFFLVAMWAYAKFTNNSASRFLGFTALAALALLAFSFGAPGNFARAADDGKTAWSWGYLIPVLGGSFEGYKWFFRTPLVPSLLFCAFLLKPRWTPTSNFSLKKLIPILAILACALFLGEFLLVYVSSKRAPYARINNAIYHSAFVFGLLAMGLLYGHCRHFFAWAKNKLRNRELLFPVLGGLLLVFFAIQPSVFLGVRNLVNGEFAEYRAIWLTRLAMIPPRGQGTDIVLEMPALRSRPFPIVFRDLEESQSKHQWIPEVFATFHGLKGVKIVH